MSIAWIHRKGYPPSSQSSSRKTVVHAGIDPITALMEEHQEFLHRLSEFRAERTRISRAATIDPSDPRKVAEFARFLARDVDQLHGRKEERGLFPVLGRHIPLEGGPIGVLLGEHESLRLQEQILTQNAGRLASDLSSSEAIRAIVSAGDFVESLLTSHIDKEDTVLFPMARELLTPAEFAEVAVVCLEIEAISLR